MNRLDKLVMTTLILISAFILLNHLLFGLFEDTALKFSLLLPVWLLIYVSISEELKK